MAYAINNLIESMVKGCESQELTEKWISAKQVKFLLDIARSQSQSIINEFNKYSIKTDKYYLNFKTSPINGAAAIHVTNLIVNNDKEKEELKSEYEKQLEQLEYLKRMLDKAQKYNDDITEGLVVDIENQERKINNLKNRLLHW